MIPGAAFLAATGGDMSLSGTSDRIAGFGGVAPVPRDSGKISGNLRRPRRYNRRLQRVFYISALFSIRHCTESRRFYERKHSEGKHHIQAVLRGTSPEHRPPPPGSGPLAVDGFLFDMNRLFEDFVTVALRGALREHGLTARFQDPRHLDTAALVRIRTDLVVRTGDGRVPLAVVDARYKIEKVDGLLNVGLYQALAYATVPGLREAHLVYAAGRFHEVRGTAAGPDGRGVRLYWHSLGLSRAPEQLLSSLRDLAGRPADLSRLHDGERWNRPRLSGRESFA